MRIGFDLDGVIFKPVIFPLWIYNIIKKINLDFIAYKNFPQAKKLFYRLIKINQEVKKVIEELKSNNNEIIIISGHHISQKKQVLKCLKKVPFDAIYLRPEGTDYFDFKLKYIKKTRCNFYVEDRADIIKKLKQKLNGECKIIYYRNIKSLLFLISQ